MMIRTHSRTRRREMCNFTALFNRSFTVTAALVSMITIAVAADPNNTTHSAPKTAPPWAVPQRTDADSQTWVSYPPHGPKVVAGEPSSDCSWPPITKISISKSHVGLYNSSDSQVAIIIQTQQNEQNIASKKLVLLEAGEFVTIECEGCARITATIPIEEKPGDGDFQMGLALGKLYVPYYDMSRKRWEVFARPDTTPDFGQMKTILHDRKNTGYGPGQTYTGTPKDGIISPPNP
jgi:hypothetical protein